MCLSHLFTGTGTLDHSEPCQVCLRGCLRMLCGQHIPLAALGYATVYLWRQIAEMIRDCHWHGALAAIT